jgi:alkylated DNA repair protein alkB homolog 1
MMDASISTEIKNTNYANDQSDTPNAAQQSTTQKHVQASAFKEAHMRFRRRPNDPSFVGDCFEMVDFGNPQNDERIVHIPSPPSSTSDSFLACDKNIYSGPLFGLVAYPGFLMAPNALSPSLQMLLAYASLTTYCEFPHRTNFSDAIAREALDPRSHDNPTLWEQWSANHMVNGSLRKLSWSTVGYHYNWSQRSYRPNQHSPMPRELRRLASCFASTANSRRCSFGPSITTLPYKATAGIVNFYHAKSVMGGHRDDLEVALHQPVISVSFGRPAVFLFGGPSLNDLPVLPILVRPGDVMIFGGPCRLNYHSMARLLPYETIPSINEFNPHQVRVEDVLEEDNVRLAQLRRRLLEDPNHVQELSALKDYLSQHRININLRQVYDTPTAAAAVENVVNLTF